MTKTDNTEFMTVEEFDVIQGLIEELRSLQEECQPFTRIVQHASFKFLSHINHEYLKNGLQMPFTLTGEDSDISSTITGDFLYIKLKSPDDIQNISVPINLLTDPSWKDTLSRIISIDIALKLKDKEEYLTYLKLKKKFEGVAPHETTVQA